MELEGNFCYICLATELQVFAFVKSEPKQFLENIFIEHGFHQGLVENTYICYQCKALLQKTFQFVQKALRAQKILHETYNESSEITLDGLKAIDRQEFGLHGNLSIDRININILSTQEATHFPEIKLFSKKPIEYEPMQNKQVENKLIEYETIGNEFKDKKPDIETVLDGPVQTKPIEYEATRNELEDLIGEIPVDECKPEVSIFKDVDPLDILQSDNVSLHAVSQSKIQTKPIEYDPPGNELKDLISETPGNECKPDNLIQGVLKNADPLDIIHKDNVSFYTNSKSNKIPDTTSLHKVEFKSTIEATAKTQFNLQSTRPVTTIDNTTLDYNNHGFPRDKCNINETSHYDSSTMYNKLWDTKTVKNKSRKNKIVDRNNVNPPTSETEKNKIKRTPYEPSAFMLSLASFNQKKRQRNKTKYVNSDDSDNSVSRKATRSILENEKTDSEFEPESELSESDDSMDHAYDSNINETSHYDSSTMYNKLWDAKTIKNKSRKNNIVDRNNVNPPTSETEKNKIKRTPYEPSAFMLSLASFNQKKRQRNKTKYVNSDDSDNSVSRKATRSILENEKTDSEFEPESDLSESDDSMDHAYDSMGRRVEKSNGFQMHDDRVFPMECDDCGAEITSKLKHHHHYVIHHPDIEYPYRRRNKPDILCQICGHVSHKKNLHEAHLATHSAKRDFACHKCPKRFFNRIQLQKHLYNTHATKLLQCDYCEKKFKTRAEIILHIRTHTGEKPFKCHICGFGLAHKGNVKVHILSKHQGQPSTSKKKQKRRKNIPVEEENDDEPLINIKNRKPNRGKAKKTVEKK